jgi:uncharacterized membrane protein
MEIDSINEHSPWWARGFAIILGVIVLLSIANLFYLEMNLITRGNIQLTELMKNSANTIIPFKSGMTISHILQ